MKLRNANPRHAPGFYEWLAEPEESEDAESCLRCRQPECECPNKCQFCGVPADLCFCDYDRDVK